MNAIINQNTSNELIRSGFNEELVSRFARYCQVNERTQKGYMKALKQFVIYLDMMQVTQPTRETVLEYKEYLKEKGLKPSTVNTYMSAVKVFFEWLEVDGIYKNVSLRIKREKVSNDFKKDYLTSAQLKYILDSIDTTTAEGLRDYAIMHLLASCGLRTIEVERALISDIATVGDSTVLWIQGKGRTSKDEYAILSIKTQVAINEYLKTRTERKDSEPLFISTSNNSKGKALSTRSIQSIVKKHLRACGFDSERLTTHSLRHTAVTLALQSGMTEREAQEFARHKKIDTTMIYSHNLKKLENRCSRVVADLIS